MKLKTSLIGLGKQNIQDHLPAIQESDEVVLDSLVDIDEEKLHKYSQELGIDGFTSIEEMIKHKKPDLSMLAVPHSGHFSATETLAKSGVHIIKEKPLALNLEEAREIDKIVNITKVKIFLTLQRRFNPIFQTFHQLLNRIGKIHNLEGRYTMNIPHLDEGWRASKKEAGGGALIDMGYHYIDLLVWYFGLPETVTAKMSLNNREGQKYDVEDTARLLLDFPYKGQDERMIGDFLISRVYPEKKEELIAYGTKGFVKLERGLVQHYDAKGDLKEELKRERGWPSAAVDQIDFFSRSIKEKVGSVVGDYKDHFKHVSILDAAYKSNKEGISVNPYSLLKPNEKQY